MWRDDDGDDDQAAAPPQPLSLDDDERDARDAASRVAAAGPAGATLRCEVNEASSVTGRIRSRLVTTQSRRKPLRTAKLLATHPRHHHRAALDGETLLQVRTQRAARAICFFLRLPSGRRPQVDGDATACAQGGVETCAPREPTVAARLRAR